MELQAVTRFRCGLGFSLLVLISSQAWADDPVAELAGEAAREYDILASSVNRAASDLLESVRQFNDEQKREPAIDWTTKTRKPQRIINADNQIESLDTELAYTVTAVDRVFSYRLKGITKIVRTGRRNTPFAASVEIEVTFLDRIAEIERVVPIPIPKGYRKFRKTDKEIDFGFILRALEVQEEDYGIFVEERFPISHSPYVLRDAKCPASVGTGIFRRGR